MPSVENLQVTFCMFGISFREDALHLPCYASGILHRPCQLPAAPYHECPPELGKRLLSDITEGVYWCFSDGFPSSFPRVFYWFPIVFHGFPGVRMFDPRGFQVFMVCLRFFASCCIVRKLWLLLALRFLHW